MKFDDAFTTYILNQPIIAWGFQQPVRVRLPNGYDAFPCGYFTKYLNGYSMIFNGASLGETAVQEAMILDPAGVPVARDTEDIDNDPACYH